MFGTLRLVLALLVVATHCELPRQFNPGVSAVVVFFLLSGFVMTATVRRYYQGRGNYGAFLLDRAGRIFPQYLFWLAATVAWFAFFPGKKEVTALAVAENVTLLPLMWVVYDLKPWLTGTVYLSQCWSLSLEWYFYMVLPPLLAIPRARGTALVISFAIAGMAALNWINPYNHGYHLLPGVLFIFLIGSILYEETRQGVPEVRTLGCLAAVIVLGLAANAMQTLQHEWTKDVLIGLIGGIPLVLILARLPAHRIDDALGNLSYGVFLNHYVLLEPVYRYQLLRNPWAIFATVTVLSLPLAWVSYRWVELPFARIRRSMRARRLAAASPAASAESPRITA